MISPERVDLMERQWGRTFAALGVPLAAAFPLFDRLVSAYSEPHRHYHTLEHVHEVLRVLGRLPQGDPTALYLAAWYHDAVYDPRASDNEARSAAVAREALTSVGLGDELAGRVAALVLATDHRHDAPPGADADSLLDADLAVLGASEERYRRYAAAVRREYSHVPEADYRRGRAAVLRHFLGRARLYRTERMHTEGEAAARRNLGAELAELEG